MFWGLDHSCLGAVCGIWGGGLDQTPILPMVLATGQCRWCPYPSQAGRVCSVSVVSTVVAISSSRHTVALATISLDIASSCSRCREVQAFITCRLDYCNSLLYGASN